MADARVRRCAPAAPQGIAPRAGHPGVQSRLRPLEIAAQLVDLSHSPGIGGLHALQAPEDPVDFPIKQPCQGGLAPLLLPFGMYPIRQAAT
jgi:hypothetical protein